MNRLTMLGAGGASGGGGGGSFTTLDPATHPNATLSNGNLTGTTTATRGWVRSIAQAQAGHISHFEAHIDSASAINSAIGIMNASQTLGTSDAIGGGNSTGYQFNNALVGTTSGSLPGPGAYGVGDTVAIEYDPSNGNVSISLNGGAWVTGTTNATGPFYAGAWFETEGITFNFGASAWVKTPSAGAQPWGQ